MQRATPSCCDLPQRDERRAAATSHQLSRSKQADTEATRRGRDGKALRRAGKHAKSQHVLGGKTTHRTQRAGVRKENGRRGQMSNDTRHRMKKEKKMTAAIHSPS